MRLDKFLKVSRIIKRRTVANEAAGAGRISINGKVAKPASEVKPGDVLDILLGGRHMLVKVNATPEVVRKEEADGLYTVLGLQQADHAPGRVQRPGAQRVVAGRQRLRQAGRRRHS